MEKEDVDTEMVVEHCQSKCEVVAETELEEHSAGGGDGLGGMAAVSEEEGGVSEVPIECVAEELCQHEAQLSQEESEPALGNVGSNMEKGEGSHVVSGETERSTNLDPQE